MAIAGRTADELADYDDVAKTLSSLKTVASEVAMAGLEEAGVYHHAAAMDNLEQAIQDQIRCSCQGINPK